MAEAALLGAVFELGLGLGLDQAFKGAKYVLSITISFNSICEKFKESVNASKPIIDEICESTGELQFQSLQDFKDSLDNALFLIEECEKTSFLNLRKRISCAKQLKAVDKKFNILRFQIPLLNLLIGHKLSQHILGTPSFGKDENFSGHIVGIDKILDDLKERLLDTDVNVVGVTGMSGIGKSTLASALYHDRDIKGYFNNRVYITVSETPNIRDKLEIMWDEIIGGPIPHFQNVEDTHKQLQAKISSRENKRTLVVLDDVWSSSNLEVLLFEGKEYKTLVTTRDDSIIPNEPAARCKQYPLPYMQEEHALSLFCLCAFGQNTIPSKHDKELVKQVQALCGGLPLALKVIGTSLSGQPHAAWKKAKKKLSRGETISPYHKEALFGRLKTSIDVLDENTKQCFLTLGAFTKGRNICANALLDIWVYARGMKWDDAFMLLLGFAARSLLELKGDLWSPAISYDCPYDLSFSQHEVMRDLALHLAMQDKKMLWTPQMHQALLSKAQTDRHQQHRKIVSIQAGVTDLPEMNFPKAEALVLVFTASEHSIPEFSNPMKKLKVLIIHNYGSRRFKLDGLDAFLPLSQLKAIRLERLIVPSLFQCCKALEKLSLTLCEGLSTKSGPGWCKCFTSPKLSEINLDRCSDLEELPTEICNLKVLKKLSVTNCHLLRKLPDDLGNLSMLQVLRLCACASLTELPGSICNLGHLEFLDISMCSSLKGFPDRFDELRCLKKLDMRECSSLRHNFQTVGKLSSLKHVLCDKNTYQSLMSSLAATSMTEQVHVENVDKPESLDWLDD